MGYISAEPHKRITVRLTGGMCDTIEQAADLLGASVSQFVVPTAYLEARRVIERDSVIWPSQKDAHKILSLPDNPPKPNKRVKDFFVFEMNAGQMIKDVMLALEGRGRVHFYGRPGSVVPTPIELYRLVGCSA
jgi:uncharacterized protein (DUF1778 family)